MELLPILFLEPYSTIQNCRRPHAKLLFLLKKNKKKLVIGNNVWNNSE